MGSDDEGMGSDDEAADEPVADLNGPRQADDGQPPDEEEDHQTTPEAARQDAKAVRRTRRFAHRFKKERKKRFARQKDRK